MLVFTVLAAAFGVVLGHNGMNDRDSYNVDIYMPGVKPSNPETYMCTAQRLAQSDAYILTFNVKSVNGRAHHVLVYGCEVPFSREAYWSTDMGSPCGEGLSQILFGWALNAPPFSLPEGVGFRVGPSAKIGYLVVQIHYGASLDEPDHSGVRVTLTQDPPQFAAGIYLLNGAGAEIPARKARHYADMSCLFDGTAPIHPFAFRPHAHTLSQSIMGYVHNKTKRSTARNAVDWQGEDGWYLIGRGDPQLPETFYPTATSGLVISPGDHVFGRCVFNSTERSTPTQFGPSSTDEMCNFYIMYYVSMKDAVDKDAALFRHCFGNSFPDEFQVPKVGQLDPDAPPLVVANGTSSHHSHGQSPTSSTNMHEGMSHSMPDSEADSTHHVHSHDPHLIQEAKLQVDGLIHLQVDTFWSRAVQQLQLGAISGVSIAQDGSTYLFHRADRVWDETTFLPDNTIVATKAISADTITRVGSDGSLLESFGANIFYMPHGIEVHRPDEVYVTDVGLHQVIKLVNSNSTGEYRVAWRFGEALKPGSGSTKLCKPSGVAVSNQGEVFVADGYCNNRIVQLTADGKFVRDWPVANGTDNYVIPHSLFLVDDLVCVANRIIRQLACFDHSGTVNRQIDFSRVSGPQLYAAAFAKGLVYAVDGRGTDTTPVGLTMRFADAVVLDKWNVNDARLYAASNTAISNATVFSRVAPFGLPHSIAVSQDGLHVVVVELEPKRATRLTLVHNYDSGNASKTGWEWSSWVAERTGLPGWSIAVIAVIAVFIVALFGVAMCGLARRLGGHGRGRRTIKATQLLDAMIDQGSRNNVYIEDDVDADGECDSGSDRHQDETVSKVRLNGRTGTASFGGQSQSNGKKSHAVRRSFLLKSKFKGSRRPDGFEPLSQMEESGADGYDDNDDDDEEDEIIDVNQLRRSTLRSSTTESMRNDKNPSNA